jgi:nucleoid-associated protein YgaU
MRQFKKAAVWVSFAALVAGGCAAKKIDTTDVPKAPEEAQVVVVPTPIPAAVQKYVVQKGDTLWAISHQMGIYSNSFEWPLIFKADRDQIQDPDEINVGQVLLIQQGQSADQVQHAIKLASDTPKFVPHVEARSPLPLDYF